MTSVLITDADHGIGPELVRQYAADGWQVFAACDGGGEDVSGPNVTTVAYDSSKEEAAARLSRDIGGAALDVVIVHSAIAPGKDRHVADIVPADWIAAMTDGAFTPAKLAFTLRPHLEQGAMKKLVAISSFAASNGGCTDDRSYSFRATKAALNSLWRSFSVECRPLGISCLLLCTDDDPAGTAKALRQVIDKAGMDVSGEFLNARGKHIPW